jgi:cysteine-rich repeat protein
MPEIDAVLIPEGASEFSIDVFFHNWSAAPVFAGACDNDVTGDDVCGWHQKLIANNGLQILSFLPATADIKHLLDPEMDSLSLTGGTPSTPQSGAVLIGTVTVRGSADNQTLNSGPGGAGGAQSVGFVSAALMSQVTRNFKIAETFNTCGDGTTVGQPHEECDDGNKDSGDGCYKNCQDESEGICTGTATANGSVSVPIESVTLTVPTVAGESAEQVVANIVDFANSADALISRGVTAEQIGTPGERFATDGSLGEIMSDTPGLPCPEPSQSLVLLTGISVLGLAGRRRFVA